MRFHPRDSERIIAAVRTIEAAPILHPVKTSRRALIATLAIERARITDYAPDMTGYMGYILDAEGNDTGDELRLYCDRALPDDRSDIRYYLPRFIVRQNGEWIYAKSQRVALQTEYDEVAEEIVQRYYFLTTFVPWCEPEGQPGVVPDLPVPGEPQLPGPPEMRPLLQRGSMPRGDLEQQIAQNRGGRPCMGCGDD